MSSESLYRQFEKHPMRALEVENVRLRTAIMKALEHVVMERDGSTILRTTDWPLPVDVAQEMADAVSK